MIVHGNVNARLDGHGHADFQLAPFTADLVLANIVHIHAQPVTGAVHVKRFVSLGGNQLVHITAEQTQLNQPGSNHLHGRFMGLIPMFAGSDFLKGGLLSGQHQLVNRLLFRRKGAIDREGAGDVAGVAVNFATGVDQHQVAVLERRIVLAVVQDAGILARRDDAAIGRHLRPALAELVIQLRFQRVLKQPGAARLHGPYMGTRADLGGLFHHFDFSRGLVQTQVVQQVFKGYKFIGWRRTLTGLGADHVDPLHQLPVKLMVSTHGGIDAITPLDQTRQDVVDIANREGVIRTVLADGTVLPGAQTVPQLAQRIALTAEQHVLAMFTPWNQGDHRLRLGKAGEVLEVAVLTVDVLDIAVADVHRRRRQNGDAIGFHLRHQRLAPTGVFRLGDADHGQIESTSNA